MTKRYIIKVETNPSFCGQDAGGVQFAQGQALIDECPLVEWFREHEGYSVREVEPDGDKVEAECEVESDKFGTMKLEELKAYANENGIDIGEATKKANILEIIREAETKVE